MKPSHVLEDLKDDSTDIESGNILTLYQQRPKIIEGLCLADFVSQFSVKYKTAKNKKALDEEFLPESENEEDISLCSIRSRRAIPKLCVQKWCRSY